MRNPAPAAPVKDMSIVIHRDGTFTYQGEQYSAVDHGPGWGWAIHTSSGAVTEHDGFDRLRDLRAFLAECERNGWSLTDRETHEKGPKGSIGTGNGPNDASTQGRG